jgi:hypothetical protein
MPAGSGLSGLDGYPFEVRYSPGARRRAEVVAGLAAEAYAYFSGLFSNVRPDIAVIVAERRDWPGQDLPYGLPFFRDEPDEIRPGIVVMSAGGGDFWTGMVEDLREASPRGDAKLRATYPDGRGGVDLQPFFDLITVHELAHAFEMLGDLRLPTAWLSDIFVNLALHAFVATRRPEHRETLEVLPAVGAGSRRLAARMRAEGVSTLDALDAHYPVGADGMSPLNYVWFQYRWMRLAARLFADEGEQVLTRFWACFHGRERVSPDGRSAASLAPLLRAEVSPLLGRAVRDWR